MSKEKQRSARRRTILKKIGTTGVVSTSLLTGNVMGKSNEESRQTRGLKLENALSNASQYLVLNSDLTITVELERAKKAGVSGFDRAVAKDFARLNNELAEEDFRNIGNSTVRSEQAQQLIRRFAPYFERIAAGKVDTKSIGRRSKQLDQKWSNEVTTMDGGCGGTRDDPHPCPNRYWATQSWSSKGEVKDHLKSEGYHETAEYAAYDTDIDWTKTVDAYGCGGGAFRNQALIRKQNGEWTYNTQGPEPNPEIHGYVWPSVDWGTYVEWWHSSHC